MKVRELISQLSKLPHDMVVTLETGNNDEKYKFTQVGAIEKVETDSGEIIALISPAHSYTSQA